MEDKRDKGQTSTVLRSVTESNGGFASIIYTSLFYQFRGLFCLINFPAVCGFSLFFVRIETVYSFIFTVIFLAMN